MDWVKLHTSYDGDPRIVAVGDAAELMFVRALAYCGRVESGGFIPRDVALTLLRRCRSAAVMLHIRRLCDAGLWQEMPEGYGITGWDHWQVNIETTRKNARERQRKHRNKTQEKDALSRVTEAACHAFVTPTEQSREELTTTHRRETTSTRPRARGPRAASGGLWVVGE